MTFEPSQIPSLVEKVTSAELEKQYYGIIGLNQLASQEDNEFAIEAIVNSGVVPSMISLFKGSLQLQLKVKIFSFLESLCCWATEHIFKLVDDGIIEVFLDVLQSKASDPQVIEVSLWGLLFVASKSVLLRDMILEQDGVGAIARVLENFSSFELKEAGTLGFAILMRGEPAPHFPLVQGAVRLLCSFLDSDIEDQVFKNALSGLVSISANKESKKSLLDSGIVSKLVKHITSSDGNIVAGCLRIIVNILTGVCFDQALEIVEKVKKKELVSELFKVIDHPDEIIRAMCYFILDLFCVGTESEVESITGNSVYVNKIIEAARNEEILLKQIPVCCLVDLTKKCSATQIIKYLDNDILSCFVDLLEVEEERILETALIGISDCLKWGKRLNLNDENGHNNFWLSLKGKVEEGN